VNRWVLSAAVTERSALRYTPAGLPALDLVLDHESTVSQEGHSRKVALQVRALAMGSTSEQVSQLPLGVLTEFVGFLAPSRNGRGLIYHITEVWTQSKDASSPQ
jgi:primosomal replication protein N